MQTKNISVRNKQVHYRVTGSGNAVMLVHGFGEDGDIFKELVNSLADKMLLIIPDLPGSGKSELNNDLGTMDDYAGILRAIMEQEAISSLIMIGHSMGGYITLAFVEKYPELVSRYGLFHSSAFADDEEKIATRQKGIRFIRGHGANKFLEEATPKLFSDQSNEKWPQLVEDLLARYSNFESAALVQYYEAMIKRPERTDVLKSAGKPVLLILGQYDNAIPFEKGLEQAHIPEICYIHVCKTSGHMGMLEEPELCISAISEFVEAG